MIDRIALLKSLIAPGRGDRSIAKEMCERTGLHITRNWVRTNMLALAKAEAGSTALVPAVEALPEPETAADFAERISSCWRKTFEAIVEAGQWLIRAKAKLDHGEFQPMIESQLPFGPRTAQKLMAIAQDNRMVANATHASLLPPRYDTLYELTKLDNETFEARLADGTIRPDMERAAITSEAKKQKRTERERELGNRILALPSARYGLILADPEWKFETWSDAGMDRHAGNHYSTNATPVIASRDVPSIAADDCVLFLWATAPMLPDALQVMEAWGFAYASSLVWVKDKQATGYWLRNRHELLLIGTRGKPIAPAMGTQFDSVIEAATRGHSVKPDEVYEMIEVLWPSTPRIELNARKRREGWECWGNEAPVSEAAE